MGCTPSKEDILDTPEAKAKASRTLNPAMNSLWKAANTQAGERAHHLVNIFATPLRAFDAATYRPPHHTKSGSEEIFIRKALIRNFVFEELTEDQLKPLVGAFEKVQVAQSDQIIKQGDEGDYFYVLSDGTCDYVVEGKVVGKASSGDSFGELALLYTCPRAATVVATTPVTLFRVDQKSFRYILQAQTEIGAQAKVKLLKDVSFLRDLSPTVITKLANAMQARPFTKDQLILKKGGDEVGFFVVEHGELLVSDLGDDVTSYENVTIQPGEHFGERAIVTGLPPAGNVVAQTDGHLFHIDKDTFQEVIGNLETAVLRSLDKKCMEGIKVIKDTYLDSATLSSLASLVKDKVLEEGERIMDAGQETEAAIYFVRSGKVQRKATKFGKRDVLETGAYFGDQTLTHDADTGKNGPRDSVKVEAPYSVKVLEKATIGVLTLQDCRSVFDTTRVAKGKGAVGPSDPNVKLDSFKKHRILGAGTFGQVWLVSRDISGQKAAYALKVQSKYELVKDGQAESVVHEKEIMSQLHHPLICNLVGAFKDESFVYMVMDLVQGGELFNVIHTKTKDGLPEKDAKFYLAGVAEGLGYMHRRGFAYRDLKPENVLINNKGYPVIVDFGFAKYVSDMTYTLCGTPLYLPPEVILNRGHNWGCDHWSLGVLLFELVDGDTPFYTEGMDQMELFRAIVKGKYNPPRGISKDGADLMQGLLQRDPRKRLGSLAGGEDDIPAHPYFVDLDFDKVRHMDYPAPMVPDIKDPLDSSNFEDWDHVEDKLRIKYPKLTGKDAKVFDKF